MRTTLAAAAIALAAVAVPACSTTYQDAMASYASSPSEALDRELRQAAERRQEGARDLRIIARRTRAGAAEDAHIVGVDTALIEAHKYDASKDLAIILDAAERTRAFDSDNAELAQLRDAYERIVRTLAEAGAAMQRLQSAVERGEPRETLRRLASEATEPVSRASSALAAAAAAGAGLTSIQRASATDPD